MLICGVRRKYPNSCYGYRLAAINSNLAVFEMSVEDNSNEKWIEEVGEDDTDVNDADDKQERDSQLLLSASDSFYYGEVSPRDAVVVAPYFKPSEEVTSSYSSVISTETTERFYYSETSEIEEEKEWVEESPASLSIRSSEGGTEIEVEETEEEKQIQRDRQRLIEEVKEKILERIALRRKNLFLHKKLAEHFKKRRMESVFKEEPKGLDLDNRYLKRLYSYQEYKAAQEQEIDDLTKTMDQFEMDSEALKQELEEKQKHYVSKAKEISVNLILTRTGKKLNEKTVDRLLRRHLEKNEEKGLQKLQLIRIKNLIEEKESQLKSLEYFGEGINVVDYEQMKIDNQNYTDKIEEKEEELTKMRDKTQGIVMKLANVREKAYAIEGDIELMEEKMYEIEKRFINTRERLTKARKKRDSLREEYSRLKSVSGLLTRDFLLRDYESSIYEARNLNKNLEKMRKVLNEKKKQECELAKIVINSVYDKGLYMELKPLNRSKSKTSR